VEERRNIKSNQQTPEVTFQVEIRNSLFLQKEAGSRLFQRLVARASRQQDDANNGRHTSDPEPGKSARVEGGSRHPAGSTPHLLTGGLLRTERDQKDG
jgi:hypothetical protein